MLILQSPNLSLPGIAHGFFGRTGGVSTGIYDSLNCGPGSGDDPAAVARNREQVADHFHAELVTLHQVHSATAVPVSFAWGEARPQADGVATRTPGIALGILTADCAPVLFADSHARVIGAAHAGWKGALGGIVESTLAAMEELGAARANIAAAIGPCIAQANYEVGAEFRDRFAAADAANTKYFVASDRAGHFRFDLEGYVLERLRRAGLRAVKGLSADTYARDGDFFSFRRATHRGETDYGRQISVIVLT
ncbi:MAG: peptidoglycan editing factor PgeF [Proteobacteria bacterium]|nr:peptidoglycan editing factor PgeF [Pseudomonadota bacterium]